MLNVVLFGAPGCGKGTQSELLEKKFGLSHISTGEIIRSQIKAQTELGIQMQEYISRGELAPDSVVISMVENYLNENKGIKGTIFDGFPRTTAQAEAFDKMLEKMGDSVDVMIYMDVPEQELVQRILLRGKDSGRADDASEEIIRNRIEIYNQQTAVVAEYYRAQGKYIAVPSLGTIDEVFERIATEIEKLA
ncbi:MAG: adenylate kinase [Alistipes sp.]|jgi:adenylate kinase|nr:adenylate kinase [Alistipes sp.]